MQLTSTAILFASALVSVVLGLSEELDESLILQPLPDGKVYSRFSFSTRANSTRPEYGRDFAAEVDVQQYTLLPLTLGQILKAHEVDEFQLSINSGQWDYRRWGYPQESSVGSGAELWSRFGVQGKNGIEISTAERWNGLTNALAGLFCASLGRLDFARATSPSLSFRPALRRQSHNESDLNQRLVYGSLASESICTENLTPFLKLLPCKSQSGLAALLNPHRLFDADWHGMSIHTYWDPLHGSEVRLTFSAVLDPVRMSGVSNKRDWSFQTLFDRSIHRPCRVARSSQVQVLPASGQYSLDPPPMKVVDGLSLYDTSKGPLPADISMKWLDESKLEFTSSLDAVDLLVRRTLTGAGQARGGLLISLTNIGLDEREVIWLETLPSHIQLYLHTLQAKTGGIQKPDLIRSIDFRPSSNQRPSLLESVLLIPPHTTLEVTIEFDKSFILYTEHPPDASRGWDLPPAIFSFISQDKNVTRRVYTPILLVDLPTPDFSMPYNVIIMSSTLTALIFGTIFNLLMRKFTWVVAPSSTK